MNKPSNHGKLKWLDFILNQINQIDHMIYNQALDTDYRLMQEKQATYTCWSYTKIRHLKGAFTHGVS
jgi:exonuclease III